ncbi:MAG: MFS transporter [Candidatus Kryptoniota bacterium]
MNEDKSNNPALKFIIIFGIISLFADMTYESAKSLNGEFLAILGASGAVVGLVSGLGELLGYSVRMFAGYASDRTGKYWSFAFTGYLINLFSVPAVALAGNWQVASILMILERVGRGIRTPARDTILSHATEGIKRGWAFGLHEALDQIGALVGPLLVALILFLKNGYRAAYALLLIPAVISMLFLIYAISRYPNPKEISRKKEKIPDVKGYSRTFWIYLAAVAFVAAGFVDFPLIAFHFKKASVMPDGWIPILFSVAMAVDGLSALFAGRVFDRFGIKSLAYFVALTSLSTPLVFLGGSISGVFGMILWGINLGAQESVMRAAVADLASTEKRGTAYGIFNTGFGLAWFVGSAIMGWLYDVSIPLVVIFSVLCELISIPIFFKIGSAGKDMTAM